MDYGSQIADLSLNLKLKKEDISSVDMNMDVDGWTGMKGLLYA